MARKDVAVKKAVAAAALARPKTGSTKPAKQFARTGLAHSFSEMFNAVTITYNNYLKTLTPRLKLIDTFLAFLVALGLLQFVYVLLVGNFPFNAFLGGFISCIGQFVLTVSLRMQYALLTKTERAELPFPLITPERALGDYVLASMVLHFITFHFIN